MNILLKDLIKLTYKLSDIFDYKFKFKVFDKKGRYCFEETGDVNYICDWISGSSYEDCRIRMMAIGLSDVGRTRLISAVEDMLKEGSALTIEDALKKTRTIRVQRNNALMHGLHKVKTSCFLASWVNGHAPLKGLLHYDMNYGYGWTVRHDRLKELENVCEEIGAYIQYV